MVNAPSSYNLLLGRPSLNKLGDVVSTVHMKMKIPVENEDVVTMRVDQEITRKCYESSLRTRRKTYNIARTNFLNSGDQGIELDLISSNNHRGPKPIGEFKEVELQPGKKVKVDSNLDARIEFEICQVFRSNLISFAWIASDMPVIDPNIICHRLNVNPK